MNEGKDVEEIRSSKANKLNAIKSLILLLVS